MRLVGNSWVNNKYREMYRTAFITLVISAVITPSYGIKCITCTSQMGNGDCNVEENLKQCEDENDVCMNIIKSLPSQSGYHVSKSCSSKQLCQNLALMAPCKSTTPGLCFECCGSDRCNVKCQSCESESSPQQSNVITDGQHGADHGQRRKLDVFSKMELFPPSPDKCMNAKIGLFKTVHGHGNRNDKLLFKITFNRGNYQNWALYVEFNKNIKQVETYSKFVDSEKFSSNQRLWTIYPDAKFKVMKNRRFVGVVMAIPVNKFENDGIPPKGEAMVCNDGTKPILNPDDPSKIDFSPPKRPPISVRCSTSAPRGILPQQSAFTDATFFKKSSDGEMYDYNELIHKSLLFYEAQRSGYLPDNNRIPWRGDSGLKDGCDVGVDLTGGYHDAGDHVKFGFPMAFSITLVAWGVIEFTEAYVDVQQYRNVLEMIKWGTDYFMQAHDAPNQLWVQVGQGGIDHSYWGHPETMDMKRVSMRVDEENPGTEVAAETAAALAAASIVFREINKEYSGKLVQHAIELFDFADKFRKNYHLSITDSKSFYKSWNGYNDELAWAAIWLFKATRQDEYLKYAAKMAAIVGTYKFSWDGKGPGVHALLAKEQKWRMTRLQNAVRTFANMTRTPGGLSWLQGWGSNRFAANYAFISLVTAKLLHDDDSSDYKFFHDYAEEQIHCILGSGDNGRSYVVGFGVNPPKKPHHRAASCTPWRNAENARCNYADVKKPEPNQFTLYGALVGGPGVDGEYEDRRDDFKRNEVAMDYNAGFQSSLAGLKYFVIVNRQ